MTRLVAILDVQKGQEEEDLGFLRLEAIKALNQIDLNEGAVPALVNALKD